MGVIEPTIRLRRLGLALKRHRESLGLSLDQAAALLRRSPSSLRRIEKGQGQLHIRNLEYILRTYQINNPDLTDQLIDWCINGRKKGWWNEYSGDLSHNMLDTLSREDDAIAIQMLELILIPGLLQTTEYAQALISTGPFRDEPNRVTRLVTIRLRRQELLHRNRPPTCHAIIDQAALHRQVGGPEVMRGQYRHLLDMSAFPGVTLQVIPWEVGAYQGMSGSFEVMDIGGPGEFRAVALDSLLIPSTFCEDDKEIDAYTETFARLRTTALPEGDSRLLIEGLL